MTVLNTLIAHSVNCTCYTQQEGVFETYHELLEAYNYLNVHQNQSESTKRFNYLNQLKSLFKTPITITLLTTKAPSLYFKNKYDQIKNL